MTEAKKYSGSCHCGNVRFEATADLSKTVTCNCSICTKSGTILTFVPVSQFHSKTGDDKLVEYMFNKHIITHLFCPTCGIKPYARGQMPNGDPIIALNVRCLDGVELEGLNPKHLDGRSF